MIQIILEKVIIHNIKVNNFIDNNNKIEIKSRNFSIGANYTNLTNINPTEKNTSRNRITSANKVESLKRNTINKEMQPKIVNITNNITNNYNNVLTSKSKKIKPDIER